MIHPGKIIELAHAARPRKLGIQMPSNYPKLIDDFFEILREREIPFVVVGGIALLHHVPGRNTDDIDLIICSPDIARLPELEIGERNEMFAFGRYGDLRVDILFAEHPLFSLVAAEFSEPVRYEIGDLPTATVDGLLLLKLFALPSLYRQFALDRVAIYEADILQLLSRSDQGDDFYLEILAGHVPESDSTEVARILGEARAKVRRIRKFS